MARMAVYEHSDGVNNWEETFELHTVEEEQHERASAQRELSDPRSTVVDVTFEDR